MTNENKISLLFSEKNTLDIFVNGDKVEAFVSIIILGGGGRWEVPFTGLNKY